MTNINDYLIWRGDIELTKDIFNEIDSLILARFSYLPFDKIKLEEKETIKSISKKMNTLKKDVFKIDKDKDLISLIGKSNRFKNMIVSDYINKDDVKNEKQFSAICIHLNDKEVYVSFLGTDGSIYGWKEDFKMSFMDDVACQIEGKKYIQKISDKYKNKMLIIGGHSKGGNIAVYSYFKSSNNIKKRIIKAYNFDGPGFSQNIIDKYCNNDISLKIENYIPQDSFVGRILNHCGEIKVVKSFYKGIMQHDIYSWLVTGKKFTYFKSASIESENFDNSIALWLNETTIEQRKIFFDTVFDLFYSSDYLTFSQITKNLGHTLPKMMVKYNKLSKAEKKNISMMISLFVKKYISVSNNRKK